MDNLHYYHSLGIKINDLIDEQRDCWTDDQTVDVDKFLEIQTQINKLAMIRINSIDRARGQIVYNELMASNYNKDNRRSQDLKDYVMITVNPREGIDPIVLRDKCILFQNLVISDWNLFCLEQRGETENSIHGVHAHILCHRDRKPYEFLKEMHRIFDPMVGSQMHIKVKSCNELKDVENYYRYMLGSKKDGNKLLKLANDKVFRQKYGLESLYSSGACPLLVGHA